MEMDVLVHGSEMHGSKNQHGSLNKIIKLCFRLIMISPQRISNVESLDNQSLVLCLSAYTLNQPYNMDLLLSCLLL